MSRSALARYKPPIVATCPIPVIKNGSFRMRNRGRSGRFACNAGYRFYGSRNIICKMGRWEEETPICISMRFRIQLNLMKIVIKIY